jgi:hypothetical protein
MAEVIYKGDHAEVLVPVTASVSVTCKWGESVEVPDALAASLLESAAWLKAGKSGGKKAAAKAAADDNDEKGATDGSR